MLNLYFDRAIAAGRLFGIVLDGHWVTAGTPEAIGPAEAAVERFSERV
jgi:MurNAc alpha-1-phosphate uridylyltransferase